MPTVFRQRNCEKTSLSPRRVAIWRLDALGSVPSAARCLRKICWIDSREGTIINIYICIYIYIRRYVYVQVIVIKIRRGLRPGRLDQIQLKSGVSKLL